jgi:hypothetical protein
LKPTAITPSFANDGQAAVDAFLEQSPDYVANLVSSLDATSLNEQTLTEELSSGVKVNSLSDDPAAAGQNVLLTSQLNSDDTFSTTASSAENLLQVSDSALGNVVTQLTSAVSLATQANNGVLNANNLQAIATELTGIRDEVLSLANSSYLGQYIFSGSQGGTQPFTLDTSTSPASVAYQGDSDVSYVQTPSGQNIQTNIPGDQIFTVAGGNVLGSLNNLIADFSSGGPFGHLRSRPGSVEPVARLRGPAARDHRQLHQPANGVEQLLFERVGAVALGAGRPHPDGHRQRRDPTQHVRDPADGADAGDRRHRAAGDTLPGAVACFPCLRWVPLPTPSTPPLPCF